MWAWLIRSGPRVLKELIFAIVVGLITDPVIGSFRESFREWARELDEEVVGSEGSLQGPQIASELAPPLPKPVPTLHPKPSISESQLAEKEPPPRRLEDGTVVYTDYCRTPKGEKAIFDVVVFSESYNWLYGSTDTLQINDKPISAIDFDAVLSSRGYSEIMESAQEIIVVGTASCEGDGLAEEERASLRARKLRDWVEQSRAWGSRRRPTRSLHILSLGQFQEDCSRPQKCSASSSDRTWGQRKVILMAVRERADSLDTHDIEWCIQESVSRDEQLLPLMQHYCRYDLNKELPAVAFASRP